MEICSSTVYSRICRKCGYPAENGRLLHQVRQLGEVKGA